MGHSTKRVALERDYRPQAAIGAPPVSSINSARWR